jgi:hypothetical protein
MQARVINAAAGERLVELRLFRQNLVAKWHGRLSHLLEQSLSAITLTFGEVKRARELEYVRRSRIAVQLARQRHAHTAPATEILDLLFR